MRATTSGRRGGRGPSSCRSRKERRKQERKAKKAVRFEHFKAKFYNKEKEKKENEEKEQLEKMEQEKETKIKEKKLKEESKKMEVMQRKRRVEQLEEANEKEELHIKSLEKKLNMRKRGKKNEDKESSKKLPKSFQEDGLDYLINFLGDDNNDAFDEQDLESSDAEEDGNGNEELGEDEQVDEIEPEDEDEDDGDNDEIVDEDDEDGAMDDEESENDDAEDEDEVVQEASDNEDEAVQEEFENDDKNIEEDIEDKERNEDETEETFSNEQNTTTFPKSSATSKYIPPAMRSTSSSSSQLRIRKQLQGQLNRLASHNMGTIAKQLEQIYVENSRGIVTEVLIQLLEQSLLVKSHVVPERLMLEHALLLVILHNNVAIEIGAQIVHFLVHSFEKCYNEVESKVLENIVMLLCHLHTFKVVTCHLIFDLISRLSSEQWRPKDVECLVVVLRCAGFALRKEDPGRLKSVFLQLRAKAKETQCGDTRIRFMIEAIKNNNVAKARKTAGDDLGQHKSELSKMLRFWLKDGTSNVNSLTCRWEQLQAASTSSRWWLLGRGWTKDENEDNDQNEEDGTKERSVSKELMELARKMRMNTETRKAIFCVVMSADDATDCHEKLLKMGKKREREIAFVLIDCNIQEKKFNPYYSHVISLLSSSSRSFRMAAQCCLWDKLKALEDLKQAFQLKNLANLMASLISKNTLTLTALKVVDFAAVEKRMVQFLRLVLNKILDEDENCQAFAVVAGKPKLKMLREGLRLFLGHFMLKEAGSERKRQIERADQILVSGDDQFML